jgi:hypothetical protein
LVYHGITHFCPSTDRWDHFKSSISINLARQLHQPLSLIDFSDASHDESPVDLSNELLAESQVSRFRGLHRAAVLNAYQAVESLANVVFASKKMEQLIASGMAEEDAKREAEKTRKEHRVVITFLLHRSLAQACDRSLENEKVDMYQRLCKLKKFRNDVAHAGVKPSSSESEDAHRLCCETVQWLCDVGGYPVRRLLPEEKDTSPGLSSLPADINAIPGASKAFLQWVLGNTPNQEMLENPCQFGLQIGIQPRNPQESADAEERHESP